MTVIKRDPKGSLQDLVAAIEKLNPLLEDQGEKDAAKDLASIATGLKKSQVGSDSCRDLISRVIDAFEGDHELMDYTHQRKDSGGEWSAADELAIASCRVLNLARRMKS